MTSDQTKLIDELLSDGMLKPPDDFTETVLNTITQSTVKDSPLADFSQPSTGDLPSKSLWTSMAVGASAVLGIFQVIGFIAGIWIPVTAG